MSAKKWLCKICADGCYLAGTDRQISFCLSYKPQTNADRIRAMSDEELAEELRHLMIYPLKGKILDWLRQPAKDGDNE